MTKQEKIKEFYDCYNDQWDYTHQQLYWWYGGLYNMYRKEMGLEIDENYPVHLNDVPTDKYNDYFMYLKKELADFWGITVNEVEKTYTVEDALEDYLAGFDD